VDECGWPANAAAPIENQNTRATTCFYEDFSKGWDPARMTLSLNHGCCMEGSYPMPNGTFYPPNGSPDYSGNIGIETQDVEYPAGIVRRKNVMRLTAVNHDMAACALPDCQQYARACFWACCCVLSCVVACWSCCDISVVLFLAREPTVPSPPPPPPLALQVRARYMEVPDVPQGGGIRGRRADAPVFRILADRRDRKGTRGLGVDLGRLDVPLRGALSSALRGFWLLS
jgi:hypothetical protein